MIQNRSIISAPLWNLQMALQCKHLDPYCQKTISADANITFKVRSLDSVYTSTASSSATKGYLDELQVIANKCGKSFESVLQAELMKISAGKGVNLPADTAAVEDSQINTSDATGQEVENIEVSPQVMQQPSHLRWSGACQLCSHRLLHPGVVSVV